MREVFVDTSFFVAILNPKDRMHQRAERVGRSLGRVPLVTTDGVLTEVLHCSQPGPGRRTAGSRAKGRCTLLRFN
jgi:predicted nucleic acid-binding protein